ncbi:amidohydrolase family protein [[Mycobacterium] manitobense]|uniref:amidohydrolase family protein n=1 Tax=[Mycobacterium] manitobense TaxID=190147 RepID=UPI0021F3AEE4|nr:amidohydrolase family protein [[Mycobacterium] manitobense]
MTARGVVDAHIHQWDPFTTPRKVSAVAKVVRRAPLVMPALVRVFPRSNREFVGDARYLFDRYLPEDYRDDAAAAGVRTVVHVQAGWESKEPLGAVDETRWIAALPFGRDGAPSLGAIVVHADPGEPGVAGVLDAHLEASPLVRGVRCLAAHHDDPGVMDWTPSAHLLAEPSFLRGFAAVAERGLTFDIWVYSHQLPDAATLAREYPQTTFVLDHFATPVGALGPRGRQTGTTGAERSDILARWRDDIAALAALPNVVAKLGGLGMPVLGAGAVPRERLRDLAAPLIAHLYSVFGPQRSFWASNYPIDKPNVWLPDSIWMLREVLGDGFDEDAVLRDNARRTYRISAG